MKGEFIIRGKKLTPAEITNRMQSCPSFKKLERELLSFNNSKKGAFSDLIVFVSVAFVLALVVPTLFFTFNSVYTELRTNIADIPGAAGDENATQIVDDTLGTFVDTFSILEWATGLMIMAMVLSIIITGVLIQTHPVAFIVYLFMWIGSVVVSVPISNAYETIYLDPILASSFSGFTAQNFIMLNLPLWMIVIGGIGAIALFVNFTRQDNIGGGF